MCSEWISEETATIPLCTMSFHLDILGTANVCEMLFVANKADLLVSKRQPVLLLCSRSMIQ
jgi:hypothetical protein